MNEEKKLELLFAPYSYMYKVFNQVRLIKVKSDKLELSC